MFYISLHSLTSHCVNTDQLSLVNKMTLIQTCNYGDTPAILFKSVLFLRQYIFCCSMHQKIVLHYHTIDVSSQVSDASQPSQSAAHAVRMAFLQRPLNQQSADFKS